MRAHPYRLIGERLGRSLRQALEPVISGWVSDWLPDETEFCFETLRPLFDYCQKQQSAEIELLVNWVDDNWCGVLKPVESGLLGSMLIGTTEETSEEMTASTLLQDVAHQALTELAQRILSGMQASYDSVPFFVTDNPFPKGAELQGSGAVVIGVRIGKLSFNCIVSPMTVERYLEGLDTPNQESHQKLTPLQAALGNQKLSARVSLGSAVLSLGELATIRVGDVVTLDKQINEPAAMRLGVNGDACEGFIGTKGNALAFRVAQLKEQKVREQR
jgi:flagellar motor switch/type III secretory pathway protein FliN